MTGMLACALCHVAVAVQQVIPPRTRRFRCSLGQRTRQLYTWQKPATMQDRLTGRGISSDSFCTLVNGPWPHSTPHRAIVIGHGPHRPDPRRRQKNYNKGEIALKHALGLGPGVNVIPVSQPSTNGPPRAVEVGWHPVGGFAGKWFAEKTGLGKIITDKVNKYPDPTQHWAVLVGEYAHQLWMDENFDIIYTNAKIDPKEWHTFPVGETKFNDDALRRTGKHHLLWT
jgi:hypothetical protein